MSIKLTILLYRTPSPSRVTVVSVLPTTALAQDVMPPPGAVAPPPHDCIAINRPSRFPAEAVASLPSIITHKSEGNLLQPHSPQTALQRPLTSPPHHNHKPLSPEGEKRVCENLFTDSELHIVWLW